MLLNLIVEAEKDFVFFFDNMDDLISSDAV